MISLRTHLMKKLYGLIRKRILKNPSRLNPTKSYDYICNHRLFIIQGSKTQNNHTRVVILDYFPGYYNLDFIPRLNTGHVSFVAEKSIKHLFLYLLMTNIHL